MNSPSIQAILEEVARSVVNMDKEGIRRQVCQALSIPGMKIQEIYEQGLNAGMCAALDKYENKEYYLPEIIVCADTLNEGLAILRQEGSLSSTCGLKALSCVIEGDTHEIGKNIVRVMMEATGLEVIDLGVNKGYQEILDVALAQGVDIITLSSMMTSTMPHMAKVVSELKRREERGELGACSKRPIIIVGGAPVTAQFAQDIEADYYAASAPETVVCIKNHFSEHFPTPQVLGALQEAEGTAAGATPAGKTAAAARHPKVTFEDLPLEGLSFDEQVAYPFEPPSQRMSLYEYINSEPRGFFLPDMATNGLMMMQMPAYEVYPKPENQLALAQFMDKTFPADFIYSLCDGAIFCETLGLDILRHDYDFPSVASHPITSMEKLKDLPHIDPYDEKQAPRMAANLKSLALIARHVKKPLYVSIQGPFTQAVQLAGATHLLRCVLEDPEFLEALLDFTTDLVKRYVLAVEAAGASMISIAEPSTVTLDYKRFGSYIVGRLNEIYDSLSCWKSLHICGDTLDLLDLMLACHTDALSLDQIMDYRQVIKRIPPHIVLLGNLDPVTLLEHGSPEEIALATLKLAEDTIDHKNFLFAFGCNCTNDSPAKNLQTAIEISQLPREVHASLAIPHKLVLSRKKLEGFLGYATREVPTPIAQLIDEQLQEIHNCLQPQFFFAELKPQHKLYQRHQELFEDCGKVFALCYTVGNKLEEHIDRLSRSCNMMGSMIADKLGVVALDETFNWACKRLEYVYPEARKAGYKKFYPAYGELELAEQKEIVELVYTMNLNAKNYIQLSPESYQLTPIKSVAMLLALKSQESAG